MTVTPPNNAVPPNTSVAHRGALDRQIGNLGADVDAWPYQPSGR